MTIDEELEAAEEVVDVASRAATEHYQRATTTLRLRSDVAARYKDFLDSAVHAARSSVAHGRQLASGAGLSHEEFMRVVEPILAGMRESVRLMYVGMTVIEQLAQPGSGGKAGPRVCSFCGKGEEETRLVAGPAGNICGACTRLACAVLGIELAR